MKFRREKIVLPSGQVEILFHEESSTFKIVATAAGIQLMNQSPTLETAADLEPLAEVIGEAMKEMLVLKKHIRDKLMGN